MFSTFMHFNFNSYSYLYIQIKLYEGANVLYFLINKNIIIFFQNSVLILTLPFIHEYSTLPFLSKSIYNKLTHLPFSANIIHFLVRHCFRGKGERFFRGFRSVRWDMKGFFRERAYIHKQGNENKGVLPVRSHQS